jgi:DNA-binding transcriptional regulator YiaG
MDPDADELLRRYPRETLRWLRRRLGLSQLALALDLAARPESVAAWETRRHGISPPYRAQLAALLAPQLATPEGAAFARALGHGGAEG